MKRTIQQLILTKIVGTISQCEEIRRNGDPLGA